MSTTYERAYTALRGIYGVTASQRIDQLQEGADGLSAAIQELRREPTADRAERLTWMLRGLAEQASKLADQLTIGRAA